MQIIIIASLVIVIDQVLQAFFFELSQRLSVFVSLIATNCIVLGRTESFARSNPPLRSMVDALGSGLGYGLVLVIDRRVPRTVRRRPAAWASRFSRLPNRVAGSRRSASCCLHPAPSSCSAGWSGRCAASGRSRPSAPDFPPHEIGEQGLMADLGALFLQAAFVENMPLTYFLGLCTFLALSRRHGHGLRPRHCDHHRHGRDGAAQPADL